MRAFLIALMIVSILLLTFNNIDAKKSRSDRKKRSELTNPTISDEKSNDNERTNNNDKIKQKKRLSIDDVDIDRSNSNDQHRKHTKVRHYKKYDEKKSVPNNEEEMKTEYKRKCGKNGKCKKNRVAENFYHNADDNLHNHDDESTSSSTSKSTSSDVNHRNQQKKKRRDHATEVGEDSTNNYNAKKQKKHSKISKNIKKIKHENAKKNKSKQEALDNADAKIYIEQSDKQNSNLKKLEENLHVKKHKSAKSNNDNNNEADKSVPQETVTRNRLSRSTNNIDPTEDQIDENVHNVPNICINEGTSDNEYTLDSSCGI